MTLSPVETESLHVFPSSDVEIEPQRLLQADNLAALLANVNAGQTIPPCRMSAQVLYYVIEGSGTLPVEQEQTRLQTGSLALVPAGAIRSSAAADPMRVLAVQGA